MFLILKDQKFLCQTVYMSGTIWSTEFTLPGMKHTHYKLYQQSQIKRLDLLQITEL